MMTGQLHVSVLAAPLAAMDRRALSQAWYSALHLARAQTPGAELARGTVVTQGEAGKSLHPARQATPHVPPAKRSPAIFARRPAASATGGAADRRAVRVQLARDIVRTFSNPHIRTQSASFLVSAGARVHVVLQTRGERVTLIAICPPRTRETVARALAQARFVLASRGIAVELGAKDGVVCS